MSGALKVWDGTAWQYAQTDSGMTVCTSTTRPSAPFNGQIIYETDTDTYNAYDDAAPAWEAVMFTAMGRPMIHRGHTADMNIATGTVTDIPMANTLDGGIGIRRFTTSDNITFTATYKGIYQVHASLAWANSSANQRATVAIYLNGTQFLIGGYVLSGAPPSQAFQQVTAMMKLDVGDGIKVVAYQQSGVTLAITNGPSATYPVDNILTAVYIGPWVT